LTWMSSDQHGTAQSTINAVNQTVSTRRALPFGEVRGGAGTWLARLDKGFVGGTNDNTGLTHIGAREYDPALGRFVSVDPVMDLADPRQWNGYAYSNSSPVTFSDPTGLYCDSCNFYAETKSESSSAGYSVGCGYSSSGMCGPVGTGASQPEMQQLWQWNTGTGDGSNQPIIYNYRLPTAVEMKKGPIFGAPVMMAPGESYQQAVSNWAKYLCRSSDPGAGFCEWSYSVGNRPATGWDLLFTVVDAIGLAAGAVGGSSRVASAPAARSGPLGSAARVVAGGCDNCGISGVSLSNARQVSGRFPKTADPGEILFRQKDDGTVTAYARYDEEGAISQRADLDLNSATHAGIPAPHILDMAKHVNPTTGQVFRNWEKMPRPLRPEERLCGCR